MLDGPSGVGARLPTPAMAITAVIELRVGSDPRRGKHRAAPRSTARSCKRFIKQAGRPLQPSVGAATTPSVIPSLVTGRLFLPRRGFSFLFFIFCGQDGPPQHAPHHVPAYIFFPLSKNYYLKHLKGFVRILIFFLFETHCAFKNCFHVCFF